MEKQIPSGIPSENDAVTERIRLCPDGVYRWFYSFSMLKNPAQLFTVWKVLGLSFGIVYLFVLCGACRPVLTQSQRWMYL